MHSDPKPIRQRARGLVLTEEALRLLDQALRTWWEHSDAKPRSKTGKLSREAKATGLKLDVKTVDRIYKRESVDEITLRTAFDALNISPRFSKEQHCVLELPAEMPPSIPRVGNLPQAVAECIGRESEVSEIKALLESARLVTLTGTGGIGKTRLATQVAIERVPQYPDGAWMVELAGVADQDTVALRVATTLGIREEQHCPLIQTLADFLRGKTVLLLLDNCEHLLEACATLADSLLASSSYLTVLATSRERLNIPAEQPYRVPSLTVPDLKILPGKDAAHGLRNYASVRLFEQRARVHRPDFSVTNQNAQSIAAICHRLDGIPLALELAAALLRAMPLDTLECELDHCFRILTGGSRTALPRHQTLQATLDWSYDRLEEKQQALLCRLSVFADGWQREAAERICGGNGIEVNEILDLLTMLVDKSLVVYQEWGGKARYQLLEIVRQYGRNQLAASGESEAVRSRHRDYFLELAEEASTQLRGRQQAVWLRRLDDEHENLRVGLEWSLSKADANASLRFCGALNRFWWMRGYLSEGREWCARALGATGSHEYVVEQAKVLNVAGALAYYQGDYLFARSSHENGLALWREVGDLQGIASALYGLGSAAANLGDWTTAQSCHEESLTLCHDSGDARGIANALNGLGGVACALGDFTTARSYFKESLSLFREVGALSSVANSLKNLGYDAHRQGDYGTARSYLEESLTLFREIGYPSGTAYALCGLGLVAYALEDYVGASSLFQESLMICREVGDRNGTAYLLGHVGKLAGKQGDHAALRDCHCERLTLLRQTGTAWDIAYSLEALASLAAQENRTERAAVIGGAAERLRKGSGVTLPSEEQQEYDCAVAQVRQTLGEQAFLTAWTQGRSLSPEQAVEYALTNAAC